MRKITREAAQAFINGVPYNNTNTKVVLFNDFALMTLFNNIIAKRGTTDNVNAVVLYDGGWETATTKERINGLLECLNAPFFIMQRKYVWYITDGKKRVPWVPGCTVQQWLEELSLV